MTLVQSRQNNERNERTFRALTLYRFYKTFVLVGPIDQVPRNHFLLREPLVFFKMQICIPSARVALANDIEATFKNSPNILQEQAKTSDVCLLSRVFSWPCLLIMTRTPLAAYIKDVHTEQVQEASLYFVFEGETLPVEYLPWDQLVVVDMNGDTTHVLNIASYKEDFQPLNCEIQEQDGRPSLFITGVFSNAYGLLL